MNHKSLFYALAQSLSLIFMTILIFNLSLSSPPNQPAAPLAADLAITKTASPDPVLIGNRLTYSVVVRNQGNQKAFSVVMTDTLPVSVRFASVSTTKGLCTQTSGTVQCNFGNVNRNGNVRVTIVVTPTVGGIITNTATTSTSSFDSNLANNTATITTTVNTDADLAISKTGAPDPVFAGDPLAYTLVITNAGPSNATNVRVTDTLPLDLAFGSASPGCVPLAGVVTCAVGALASGSSRTLTITATPGATVAGTIVNTAVVGGDQADPVPANNTANDVTTVVPKADLAVQQTSAPAPALLGNLLSYTITLTNNGPSAATGVVLTDTLPAGVTFSSASPGCSPSGLIITCNIGVVSSGSTVTITIGVVPNATGLITNTVSAAGNQFDPNISNNTQSASTTVIPAADLSIVKTSDRNLVLVGVPLTYTIDITNDGPSSATNVIMTDVLPSNVTLGPVASNHGPCSGSGPITCTLGTLDNAATASVTIVVTPTVIGAIVNTAEVNSDVVDPNPANNTAALRIAVNPVDLSVSKTASARQLLSNNPLTYTVVVTNNGPLNGTGVRLTDTLPANVTLGPIISSQGTCSGTNMIGCALGALDVGKVATVTVVVTPTVTGTFVNTVVAGADQPDPNPLNNVATATTAVNPIDLFVSKTAAPDPVYAGSPLTYTLVITNHGPSNATGVIVTDTLPANVVFGSASNNCAPSSNQVICSIGALSNGSSRTLTVTVTPGAAAVGIITNTAVAGGDQPEAAPANNTATAVTTVQPMANLSISKTGGPDPVYAGGDLIYVLTAVNNGPSTATNVVVTDTLPAAVAFKTASSVCSQTGGIVTCTVGTLPLGSIVSLVVVATPTASAAGLITNTASVAASEHDSSPANNTAMVSTTVIPLADLAVMKTAAPSPAQSSSPMTYTVTVTNAGPSNATGVILTDTLPGGVTFNSASPGCAQAAGVVTCSMGLLASSASRTITISVTPQASTSGTLIENVVNVASNVLDPDPTDNSFVLDTAVDPADLAVVKTGAPNPVYIGRTLTYTLVVTNYGPSGATGVTLVDTLPSNVTFRSASAGCSIFGIQVTCDLASIAAGFGKTVTIVVTPTVVGTITNTALVDANEADVNPANNTATASTNVVLFRQFLPIIRR